MKKILFYLLFSLPILLIAQPKSQPIKPFSADEVKDAKMNAESYYKVLNFGEALKLYERLVVTQPNNADFNYKLGLCYLNTNINKGKSVPFIEYAANANTKEKPKDVNFDLARSYYYAGLYDKALETYEKFRLEKKGIVEPKLKFDLWLDWCITAKKVTQNSLPCTFTNLGKSINSNGADYRPLMGIADTVVYFSSKRKGNTGGLVDDFGEIPSDVYFWTQNDSAVGKVKSIGININSQYYEDILFLSGTGDKLIFTKEGPEASGDLYMCNLNGKSWDKAVSLGKDFITKTLETGATMTPDGLTLYFAAEAEGSKTGKDIYMCTRTESTSWGKPVRLDNTINSIGDEDNPVLWLDGTTLFFSSTGHGSMGGYDIYKSESKNPREGFSQPVNIGYPLNTVYDEYSIALAADGMTGYISSVRDSGMGDYDIYKVQLEKPLVSKQLTWVQGKAFTNLGTPAKDAFIVVTEKSTGTQFAALETNSATGRFDLALPPGTYNVVGKHAKLGKTELEITIEANYTYKQVVQLNFK